MKIAIVTGASSGLGREFVKRIDSAEPPDEFWLIARREERLRELSATLKTPCRFLSMDLTKHESIAAIEELLRKEAPRVALLVNAAGFGRIGLSADIPLQAVDDMIALNCRAAVDMTQICLPYLGKGSRVLEICSTSAFQPFPYVNVYAASKAFLYRYSRALRIELMRSGVGVTAVCPYWIRDTEFIPGAKNSKSGDAVRSFPLSSRAERVARRALADSRLRLPVSTPGIVCFVHRIFCKLVPSELSMWLWSLLRRL